MTETEIMELNPGEDFDAIVAKKIMGWELEYGGWYQGTTWFKDSWSIDLSDDIWSPSTKLTDAWEVINKMYEKGLECNLWMTDDYEGDKCYRYTEARFFESAVYPSVGKEYEAEARTTPEAICKAALLVAMKEEQSK